MKQVYSMQSLRSKLLSALGCLVLSLSLISQACAHLMVAQNGTLNFLDDDVFLVVSLPATAFVWADTDGDERLSIAEFAASRMGIITAISEQLVLRHKRGPLQLHSIMVSPVTPHDAPKSPARNVVVMGRFSIKEAQGPLQFSVDLFGSRLAQQSLKITATHKAKGQRDEFTLTPDNREKVLFTTASSR